MVKMTRSKTFQAYLPSCHRTYSCIHCRAHLANHDELISKSFQGSQGRAYLFNSVVNVGCGPAEERVLLTGLHAVADIYCENCKTTLGWKYQNSLVILTPETDVRSACGGSKMFSNGLASPASPGLPASDSEPLFQSTATEQAVESGMFYL
ncbi:protein yippee-like 2 isoform X2 [Bubalus kerabau]|uniref:protein yippee-like 2 isoform X2 n=1 Tax=Bubalus carabanensis TaxID=3119969 RepID=UPI00244EBC02|nr:protein yippee-like 2 isoform X2 [Bubalus carabanensis]XP_055433447.1 protein yippee-like 2 isoform X2 [Bubalus carabanensis]XP_055433448.1 protein yippee-like 2 isoform X2 [Bubalus carabanensis]XP_055433449.1 protein yippee-like 2 isoform X2 [Bubalus carabanensis]